MSGGWWKEGEGAEPEWQWVVRWLLSLVVGQQGLCEADGSKSSAVVVFSFQWFCGGFRFVQSVRGCVFAACANFVLNTASSTSCFKRIYGSSNSWP